MFYFVHLNAYDDYDNTKKEYKVLVEGIDFHEALNKCFRFFDESSIVDFLLIKPVSPYSALIINDKVEEEIQSFIDEHEFE
jgi:hypothetical protein